ncbi:hypothetical protein [Streptoalloteichus hindustanus]|uniref:Lipase (Class 3) n=1 Tax=Streptoalloteichus hindustanus TaxID=2017 RepID=A0A1M5K182_STRHI|nr:hypothetical protein [Streptoalloteichus hindustanus]SHG46425.1 hypothetical protein SAMN05444320_109105 [Streptoalloteichus hindustanus]
MQFEEAAVLVPGPDTRVVELRVHGVMGNTAESLVDAVSAVDVDGDTVGRVVRPADRMRRPVPGPVLHAGGRPVPRTVEGYVWGRMTSGGWAKATWALLFPFSLANVAHWMLPPTRADHRGSVLLGAALRGLLRLVAVLLTLLFVAQWAVVCLDLVAAQCLAPGASCLPSAPDWLRELTVLRALLGMAPVALVVLGLHRVSAVDWRSRETRLTAPARQLRRMPAASVVADPDTPALRSLHTTAALAVTTLLTTGGPTGPAVGGAVAVLWWASVALLLASVAGVLALDDPTGAAEEDRIRRVLGPGPRAVLLTCAGVLFALTALTPPPMTGALPGSDDTVLAVAVGLAVCCGLVAALLAPAAWLARGEWAGQPRDLRPWAGGWMAAPVLALAGLLGGGFGAGVAITTRQVLRSPELVLPPGYTGITLLWGAGAALGLVATLALVAVLAVLRRIAERRGRFVPPEVELLHAGRPEDARVAARAWWLAELQRRYGHRVLVGFTGLLSAGAITAGAIKLGGRGMPGWAAPLSGIGVVALAALAVGLLRIVYVAACRPDAARRVGLLADLASFWPREAHPTVPPCYALKVVPELTARALEHLDRPGTRVVLVGHSQGSLLATVTAARVLQALPESERGRIGLVTAGSQLQWAYPRAFPAVVPHSSLVELSGELRGRWRSLCRGTDPLGGAVSTWSRQVYGGKLLGVGFRQDGAEGPLPSAVRSDTGALVLGGDHWLPDPQAAPVDGRRWTPGVLGHRDYFADPEWDRAIAMAAGLERPPTPRERKRTTPEPPPSGALPRTRTVLTRPAVLRPPVPEVPEQAKPH